MTGEILQGAVTEGILHTRDGGTVTGGILHTRDGGTVTGGILHTGNHGSSDRRCRKRAIKSKFKVEILLLTIK